MMKTFSRSREHLNGSCARQFLATVGSSFLPKVIVAATLCLFVPASGIGAAAATKPKPNLKVSAPKRCFTPDEPTLIHLEAYNAHQVSFAVRRLDIQSLIHTSRDLSDFSKVLARVPLAREAVVKTWKYGVGKIDPDNWEERDVKAPKLPPGIYAIQAVTSGIEARTWLAVTPVALLSKRSRQGILVFAADAVSGKPIPRFNLRALDEKGNQWKGATGRDGLWQAATPGSQGNFWIFGSRGPDEGFVISGAQEPPPAFVVYTTTDRPVYRPGQKVLFRGSVRRCLEPEAPGGLAYQPYANRKTVVEIRDPTDALVSRRELSTNAYGSYDGSFQLAAEPSLGNWQVVTSIGDFRTYSTFSVLAYRKPEFSVAVRFDQAHYLGGSTVPAVIDAQYYFGQPVSNTPVHYTVNFAGQGGGDAEPPYEGQGVTDASGHLNLSIMTRHFASDRTVTVSASVTDLSRRTQSGSGSALITAALFRLWLETDKSFYRPGDTVSVTVTAGDYDDLAVQTPVEVRFFEIVYDRLKHAHRVTTLRTAATNREGQAVVQFRPLRPGSFEMEASAHDAQKNLVKSTGSFWVAGEGAADENLPTLSLSADRSGYRPGETANVLVKTSLVSPLASDKKQAKKVKDAKSTHSRGWALVTLQGERLYYSQLVPLNGHSTLLKVPLTALESPAVQMNVAVIQDRQLFEQQTTLQIPRVEPNLSIAVTPTKEFYAPGETATYTVATRDYQGRPVPAEVALAVVDSSIYAIQADNAPDIHNFFYPAQTVRVSSDFSLAGQYSGGAYQTMASPGAGETASPAGVRVRRLFADTAYWNPSLVTDAAGKASISFTMPDNLTTWRATGRGITRNTAVGSATSEVKTTMPLLVRLELPRFYVQGDQAVVSAIVHNYTGSAVDTQTEITANGAALEGDSQRSLHLEGGAQQRLDWRAHITGGSSAKFLVTVRGGASGSDAMELTLPVLPDGLKMVQARSDVLPGENDHVDQNLDQLPPGAGISLTLSPSIGSALFDALGYITSYPYGCAEQTMSSLLPDIMVSRTLRRLNVHRQVLPDLDGWVNLGLQKLYRYQHGDGGWHWWEFDPTDGDMTSYVLWGLVQARDAGYLVDQQRILRGTDALLRLLQDEQDPSRRADWMLTLASVRPDAVAEPLVALYKMREKLDLYGKASLCLALDQMARQPAAPASPVPVGGAKAVTTRPPTPEEFHEMARTIARDLDNQAQVQGTSAHWPAEQGGYSWRGDDVDVTAHVLRAVLAVLPQSTHIQPAVKWLMFNRRGQGWGSTQTTAEAIFALAQYLEQTRELEPNFQAQVKLDGQVLQSFNASRENVFNPPATITLNPDQLKGRHQLSVEKRGTGILYLNTIQRYTIPPEQAKSESHGIAVARTFQVSAEDPSQANSVASGEEITVNVEITADSHYQYAMIEDPVPAGCEIDPTDDTAGRISFQASEGAGGWARQEVRDDRVVFFFDDLPKGRTLLSYRLHAETPGLYRILPSIASLVYFPEIRGNSAPVRARINERP